MTDDDRRMLLTRRIAAPPEAVWRAWTDPDALPRWFGPNGFSCRTKHIDIRPGGEWVFDMVGPDGTVYPNRHRFGDQDPPHRLTYLLDEGEGTRLHAEVEVRFDPHPEGTELTLDMLFVDLTRAEMEKYGVVEKGYETLDKLAAHVAATGGAAGMEKAGPV